MKLSERTLDLVRTAARAADKVKGGKIVAFNVSVRCPLTDVFVIVSGNSDRQVGAIIDEVGRQLAEVGVHAVMREGDQASHWVLLDYGEFVVHVLHTEDREFYGLDRLWKDCPRVALPQVEPQLAGAGQGLGAQL